MSEQAGRLAHAALQRIGDKTAVVGIVGLGYVGLPLGLAFCEVGLKVVGFDVDASKSEAIAAGRSYIKHIPSEPIARHRASGLLESTTDLSRLGEPDALLVCVPTPLTRHLEPDLSYLEVISAEIVKVLRPGQIVILESTTYPGTTDEVMKPILEAGGLKAGHDFFIAYSPEREDPGNPNFSTSRIPKVVGADDANAKAIALALYGTCMTQLVPVSSAGTAEAVKITENVFRAVNIALVNELKLIFTAMGIDIWEVIEAAKTKPFGFMPFYPGPGLGGHCIPIDPFYLTWKAREFNHHTRFIELAGQINSAMPEHVVRVLAETIDRSSGKGLNGARILMLGVAYKKNVDDLRESPALRILELLDDRKAVVDYHDPYIARIETPHEHPSLDGRVGVAWSPEAFKQYDAALIVTDHDTVDYAALVASVPVVVDTRNACARAGVPLDRVTPA